MIKYAISLGLVGMVLAAGDAEAVPSVYAKAAIACAEKVRTTADTRACWITQIGQANKSLDQEYKRFLKAVSSEERETPLRSGKAKRATLVAAQADWVKYHRSHCNLYLDVYDGTMWHPVSDQCILGKIEERLKELTDMRRHY